MKKNTDRLFPLFTLVELLMVCVIIAILVGMGIGVFSVASRKSRESRAEAMIRKMSIALEAYKNKTGYYIQQSVLSAFYVDIYKQDMSPPGEYTINDAIDIPDSQLGGKRAGDRGAWLDPFRREFRYRCPGVNNRGSFDLRSKGADGIIDTADDIKNW